MRIEEVYIDQDHVKSGISSSNVYRLGSEVVIDTGSSDNAGMKDIAEKVKGAKSVVITYAHETHTENLSSFPENSIELYSAEPSHWEVKEYSENQKSIQIEDGDTLNLAGKQFRALVFEDEETNRKKLALYCPEQKIVFSGDVDPQKFENLDFKKIYPAHGRPKDIT